MAARIPGPADFGLGQGIARPTRYNENAMPGALAPLAESLQRVGGRIERQDMLEAREAMEAKKAADRGQALTAQQAAIDDLAAMHDEQADGVVKGTIPKDGAVKNWQETSRERVSAAVEGVPEEHRTQVQRALDAQAARLGRGVQKAVTRRNQDDSWTSLQQTAESSSRLYAKNPEGADAVMDAAMLELGPASGRSQADVQALGQRYKEGSRYTKGYSLVNGARYDNAALGQVEQQLAGDEFASLDPQRRAVLQSTIDNYRTHNDAQADRARDRAMREQEHRLKVAESSFTAARDLALTGTLNPEYAQSTIQKLAGTPFQDAFREVLQQQRAAGPLAAQPVAQVRGELDSLNAQIAVQGLTPQLQHLRQRQQQVLDGQQSAINKDGALRAAAARGVLVAPPPLDLSGGIAGAVPQLADRMVAAEQAGRWTGKPESPLYPEEAAKFQQMFAALPPDQQGNSIAAMAQALPPGMMQAIARQIDQRDRPLSLAMKAGAAMSPAVPGGWPWSAPSPSSPVAALVMQGAAKMADQRKTPGTAGDAIAKVNRQAAIEYLDGKSGTGTLSGTAREDILETAELINAGFAKSDPTRALKLAIGGDLIDYNGRRIPVPDGISLDQFRDRVAAYPAAAIDKQAPSGYVVAAGARPMGVPEFVAQLPSMQLEPAGLGRYFVRNGAGIAMSTDGVPIVISLKP